jgi:putative DNA primase/helicase
MGIIRNWLVELPELSSLKRTADLEQVKAFLTQQTDAMRLPYGKSVRVYPRRSLFIGTTNDDQPLVDTTGNRRFWIVTVNKIDFDRLVRDRDQLWAEAVEAFKAGEVWWLSQAEEQLVEAENEMYEMDMDPVGSMISGWLSRKNPQPTKIRTEDIIAQVLCEKVTRESAVRAGKALRRMGYTRRRDKQGWFYFKPGEQVSYEA